MNIFEEAKAIERLREEVSHLSNGTLKLDGSFIEGKPDVVRNRLPVAYRPDASIAHECPSHYLFALE